ncbi:uncharacterized protein B0H18DRAFT_25221 [Fomitopsis serialis]|uniref:uncharacterized protein n=1 Tax=Fomitopsis serialis TaxID=139415 RepID=UPI002007A42F|nr:uncharacterized protein B0H18DRAFT_25221 [Neoantrodia serialis]KAH9932446.1 hypothetical protein B0H18DRAFT_25221 [Neoantrodia serialis]
MIVGRLMLRGRSRRGEAQLYIPKSTGQNLASLLTSSRDLVLTFAARGVSYVPLWLNVETPAIMMDRTILRIMYRGFFYEALNNTPAVDEGREDRGEDVTVSNELDTLECRGTQNSIADRYTTSDTTQRLVRSSRRHTGFHPPLLLLDDFLAFHMPVFGRHLRSNIVQTNQPAQSNQPWHDVVLLEVERGVGADGGTPVVVVALTIVVVRRHWPIATRSHGTSPSGQSTDAPRPRSRPCWVFGGILPERLERAGVGAGSYAQSNAGGADPHWIQDGSRVEGRLVLGGDQALPTLDEALPTLDQVLPTIDQVLPADRRNVLWQSQSPHLRPQKVHWDGPPPGTVHPGVDATPLCDEEGHLSVEKGASRVEREVMHPGIV